MISRHGPVALGVVLVFGLSVVAIGRTIGLPAPLGLNERRVLSVLGPPDAVRPGDGRNADKVYQYGDLFLSGYGTTTEGQGVFFRAGICVSYKRMYRGGLDARRISLYPTVADLVVKGHLPRDFLRRAKTAPGENYVRILTYAANNYHYTVGTIAFPERRYDPEKGYYSVTPTDPAVFRVRMMFLGRGSPPPADNESPPQPASRPSTSARPPDTTDAKDKPAAAGPALPANANYEALIAEGTALSEKGRIMQAMRLFELALKLRPAGAEALTGIGWLHLDQERFSAAMAFFKRALAATPSSGAAMIGMAETYKVQGNTAKALEYYRAYLQKHPGGPKAVLARRNVADLEHKDRR